MPIYEYRRKTDGEIIEVRQSIKDDPLTKCPETGDPVEKIVSRSSFHLKGQGWYTTDYKKPAEKLKTGDSKKPTEKSAETAAPEKKTDKPSDSAPPKTESKANA